MSSITFGTSQFPTSAANVTTTNTTSPVVISIPSSINYLDPLFTESYYDQYIYGSIYQPLYDVRNTTNNLYNWQIAPVIASSYSVSPNGTTWTFNIRSGLIWSDEIPLNASDVLYTYQILMNPTIDVSFYPIYSTFFASNASSSMRVVNATQIVFNLLPNSFPANHTYTLVQVFTGAIIPKHVFTPLTPNAAIWQADITNTGTGANRSVLANGKTIQINGPTGSGPYKYAGYNATTNIWTLTINPNFNAGIQGLKAPSIQTIKLIVNSNATTAVAALNSGAVQLVDSNTNLNSVYSQLNASTVAQPVSVLGDIYQEMGYNQFSPIFGMNPPNQVNFYGVYNNGTNTNIQTDWWTTTSGNQSNVVRAGNITWITQEQLSATNVGIGNVTADQWFYTNLNSIDRLNIRLAMDYAIPRTQILNTVLNGHGSVSLATWVTPYFNIYDTGTITRTYNTTMASNLLTKVFGYTYNPNASDYTKTPYFTINFLVPNSNPLRVQWAADIANSFTSLGIKVNTNVTSFVNLLNTVIFNTSNIGFDYAHGGWDTVFIGSTWDYQGGLANIYSSMVPDLRSEVQSQYNQAAGNFFLINNSQITAISNWMLNQTGPNAVSNATAFQQWCYNNVPTSVIEEDQNTFGVANQLEGFNPTYQQFNYNEWSLSPGTTTTTVATTSSSPPTTTTVATTSSSPPTTTTSSSTSSPTTTSSIIPLTSTPSFDFLEVFLAFMLGILFIYSRRKLFR